MLPGFQDIKSPVVRAEDEGLQLDTRAEDSTEKDLDPLGSPQGLRDQKDSDNKDDYLSEKQAAVHTLSAVHSLSTSPNSSSSTISSDRASPVLTPMHKYTIVPSAPKARRTCGVRRHIFWVIFGVILAVVIAAAIIGGAIAGRRHSLTDNPNIATGSPLNIISYSNAANSQWQLRMYFQSESGNIKEKSKPVEGGWLNATPIVTDAIKHTGLATITYNSISKSLYQQHGSIFYITRQQDGIALLREKRTTFSNDKPGTEKWDLGSLGNFIGNFPALDNNNANGYQIAAVYYNGSSFSDAGCRLFYHTENETSNWVQELIWYQTNDTWTQGGMIEDVLPNSHLSATIGSSSTLRLFYVDNNNLLKYQLSCIGGENQNCTNNLSAPPTKVHPAVFDFTAVTDSENHVTHVYYSSSDSTIRELNLTNPGTREVFSKSRNVFLPHHKTTSPYQPLTAVKTESELFVFWANKAGTSNKRAGYANLQGVSAKIIGVQPSNWSYPVPVSLGDTNNPQS